MKKNLLALLVSVLALSNYSIATTVSPQRAETIAANFYKITYPGATHHVTISTVLKYTKLEADNTIDFYVFDINPLHGFVIVAADDNVEPILAYSNETNFNTSFGRTGVSNWVYETGLRIHYIIQQQFQADARITTLWSSYLQGVNPGSAKAGSVSPLLTTTWDQEPYYNMDCPFNNNDNQRAMTGCVATAMAQIMKYWNYPAQGTGSHSYNAVSSVDGYNYGSQSVNFGTTTYNWAGMPNYITSNNTNIGTIMYQCGVSVNMDYGDDVEGGSGAFVLQVEAGNGQPCAENSYKTYFSYNPNTLQGIQKSNYSASSWIALIEGDLNASRPVQYDGQDPQNGGHTWVCDGYDVNDNMHMNWGWSGQDNGYFSVSNLNPASYNFTSQNGALIGIEPSSTAPVSNFTASSTTSCNGTIQFTDLSSGTPTSWLWNFGDGGTSTLQNPSHTYTTNGTYTVKLTATNSVGSNLKTLTNYITISKPAGPTASNVTGCGAQAFTLHVTDNNPVAWFNSSGTQVSNSNSYTTPVLSTSATYYVQDTQPTPQYHVGPANNTIGAGANFTTAGRTLVFNVAKPGTLASVYVYATGAGNRTFQITDSAGTTVLAQTTVNVPDGASRVTLNLDLVPGGPYNFGVSNTTPNLYRNSAGAVFPYTDANGIVSITGNNAGSTATTYYYFAYDWIVQEHGCVSQRTAVTATVSTGLVLGAGSVTNASCNGATNGSATVSVTTGTPTYTYHWSNNQSTATASNLAAGTYPVTITDAAGCSITTSKTVTAPAPVTVSFTTTNGGCTSAGSALATATGGTSGYTYVWSTGAQGANLTGVGAGTYIVTATDAHTCTAVSSTTITSTGGINLSSTSTDVNCFGNATGTIDVTVAGGVNPITYTWSNGLHTSSLSNVAAGTYIVTVIDANGCSSILTKTIAQPSVLSATVNAQNAGCGSSNGSATVSALGGTTGYTYTWSTGAHSITINGLAAATYLVTVTDNHNCTASASAIVSAASTLVANMSAVSASCHGSANGSASASVVSGSGPYNYVWSGGAGNTATVSNLAAGTYSVTITDALNCPQVDTVSVSQPSAIVPTIIHADVLCYGDQTGSALVSATGGVGPYVYTWGNGSTLANNTDLGSGTYIITVTDSHHCSVTSATTVNQPSQLQITVSATADNGQGNGTASVTGFTGGTPPYTVYRWSNGQTTNPATNLSAGTYTVTVKDQNGCEKTATATVQGATGINDVKNDVAFSIYPNPAKYEVTVQLNTWNSGTIMSLKNVLGQTMFSKTIEDATTVIDLGAVANGVYFIELKREESVGIKQFIITK